MPSSLMSQKPCLSQSRAARKNDAIKLEEASVQLWSKTYTVWEACA
jgi:hypothetical protein